MKFKYEFEEPDDFEKGCCANCPLCIIDLSDNLVHFIIDMMSARWKKVNEGRKEE